MLINCITKCNININKYYQITQATTNQDSLMQKKKKDSLMPNLYNGAENEASGIMLYKTLKNVIFWKVGILNEKET